MVSHASGTPGWSGYGGVPRPWGVRALGWLEQFQFSDLPWGVKERGATSPEDEAGSGLLRWESHVARGVERASSLENVEAQGWLSNETSENAVCCMSVPALESSFHDCALC